jgi:hypothetical protein
MGGKGEPRAVRTKSDGRMMGRDLVDFAGESKRDKKGQRYKSKAENKVTLSCIYIKH